MIELLIFIINIFIHIRTISNKLIIDDLHWMNKVKLSCVSKDIYDILSFIRQRIYGCFTFYTKKLSDGNNIFIDHCFRILLNCTIAVLIYKAFGSNNISLWASILYSVHPINNQTSLWLNGRRYALNIILVLLAYCIGSWGILLYPLMPFLQFNAAFFPILLFNNSPLFLLAIPIFFLIGNSYIIKWFKTRQKNIPEGEYKTYHPRRLIVIIKTFGIYITTMLLPRKILFYSDKLYFWGISHEGNKDAYKIDSNFFVGVNSILAYFIIGTYIPREYLPIYIFMFFSVIQWCNIITVTQTIADRYASLPNVFMMFLISWAVNTYIPQYATAILLSIAVYYLTKLNSVMNMYKDITAFYEYHVYHNKKDVSCRVFKATDCMINGDFMRAFIILKEGVHYVPNDFKLLFQLACCSYKLGDKKLCLELLDKAEKNYYLGQEANLSNKVNTVRDEIKKQTSG